MRSSRGVGTRRGALSTRTMLYVGLLAGLAVGVPISLSYSRGAAVPVRQVASTAPIATPLASTNAPAPLQAPAPLAVEEPPFVPAVDAAEEARERRLEGLQALLDEEVAKINGTAYVHVRLQDGGEAGVQADYPVDPASVIKIPVMVALFDAWASRDLKPTNLDQRRMRAMITRSRNIVTNELIDKLGMDRINDWLSANGYHQTVVQARILDPEYTITNYTTAEESTRLLDQILRGQAVSEAASKKMRALLLAQRWRERIPADLPDEAVCGNKTGTMSNLLHDVGFVEAPNGVRYTIAVFIERESRAVCKSPSIAALSRRVYDYLTATAPARPAERLTSSRPGERVPGGEQAWTSESGTRSGKG